MLSRRVGHRWVHYAKRTGQRDAQLGRVAPGDSNVIDLLVDQLPEATYVVLVDVDACDRAEEPFEHRNTRRMGHALPPVHRSRLTSSTQGWQFAADTEPDPQVQRR